MKLRKRNNRRLKALCRENKWVWMVWREHNARTYGCPCPVVTKDMLNRTWKYNPGPSDPVPPVGPTCQT